MSGEAYLWSVALKRAIKRNRRDAHNRYLQLATVRRDGTPAVRSLVFRQFCDTTKQLQMVTDRRSAKVDEIAANGAGEICWYFSHSREQFRLSGTLTLAGAETHEQRDRVEVWGSLSEKAREQFYWPHPGAEIASDVASKAATTGEPPDDFMLLALAVTAVDHLSLRGDPQSRMLSRLDGQGAWVSRPVNP